MSIFLCPCRRSIGTFPSCLSWQDVDDVLKFIESKGSAKGENEKRRAKKERQKAQRAEEARKREEELRKKVGFNYTDRNLATLGLI